MTEVVVMKKRILTIDGGGIRGIIPAVICVEIEKQTGKKINELFDLISGTSTGTILGAGLAVGIPAQDILNMYIKHGEEIFTKRTRWYRPWQYITKSKYYKKYINELLNKNYGEDTKITDINKTNFMCAAYDAISKKYEFFTSWQDRYSNRKLVDVALYSMSAIAYFGKSIDEENGAVYTDGAMGLYNSTPVSAAIETSKLGWDEDEKFILNLGCGEYYYKPNKMSDVKKWNNIDQIFNIYFSKEIAQINRLKESVLKSDITKDIFLETVDVELSKDLMEMDAVKNIESLYDIGVELAKKVVKLETLK